MHYCHVGTIHNGTLVWAILVWQSDKDLPAIRFATKQNSQTQMLAKHAPQAVASLIELGHTEISITGAGT